MSREIEILRLLDAVYEAAFEPARWFDALDVAVALHGARGGRINFTEFALPRDTTLAVRGIDADFHGRWMAEHAGQDVWAIRGLERLLEDPRRRTATGAELVPFDELRRQPVYGEVLEPHGLDDALMTALAWTRSTLGGFAVWRGPSDPRFDERDCALHDWIGRHASRALTLGAMLREERERERALLERLPCAAFVVTEEARIVLRNREGERLLQGGGGLTARRERLGASDPRSRAALEGAIALAAASGAGRSIEGGATLRVGRGPSRSPLVVLVQPLPPQGRAAERLQQAFRAPTALVLASDPEDRALLPEEALAAAFGLTPAESRMLSDLCAGATPNEVAEAQGISRETARYHVKQLIRKMGARRQADLVRIALESVVRLVDQDRTGTGGRGR